MSKAQPEFLLQAAVAEYLRLQYKGVMFLSDVRASMRLSIPQQVRSKKIQADGFACPDMMIFQAAHQWHGMFLEIKAESPYCKGGSIKKSAHLDRQYLTILQLRTCHYWADFYWNFDEARASIDWYLGGR